MGAKARKRRETVYLIPVDPILVYEKQTLKRRLLRHPGVYRITDHGAHLKVNSTRPVVLKGQRVVATDDRTVHWDEKYWDFAMRIFRYSVRKGHCDTQTLGVAIHYLCNLFGTGLATEAEYLAGLALGRVRVEATMSEEQTHGWELKALKRGKKR